MNLKFAVLGLLLLVISVIDYRRLIIPDELLLLGLVMYLPLSWLTGDTLMQMAAALLHGCWIAVPLLLFVLMCDRVTGKETMGFGDIKLFFVLGVYLGAAQTWLTLFLSCVVGLLWYWLRQNRDNTLMPFGPSIAIAAWFTMLWGEPLLDWYTGYLL